jgi:hypothetical protein
MRAAYGIVLACLGLVHCGGGGAADAGTSAPPASVTLTTAPQASAKVLCSPPAMPAALPDGYPPNITAPALPLQPLTAAGFSNWTAGYQLHSMVYHLAVLRDPAWAAGIIDTAESMLARRDAVGADGQPYAWLDRSSDVKAPYAWLAFGGHLFAPLMQFSRLVVADSQLAACTYQGKPLGDYAARYLTEFDRLLAQRSKELVRSGGESWHVFDTVPSATGPLTGLPLPVNMDADVFLAMLHSIPVEAALGSAQQAAERKVLVQEHVQHLMQHVLHLVPCSSGRTCLRWNYSSYSSRSDDVGHSNVVAKFLLDAHDDGYAVPDGHLTAFASTMDSLIDASGQFTGNLLDGTTVAGVVRSVYYEILYGRFSDSLRAKLQAIVMPSGNFSYAGPWLKLLTP